MKKKNDEERKPDLNEADDQAEIEARIREMMELEPAKPEPPANGKSISVTMHDDDAPLSAPELPAAKKPLSIKIVDHNELADDAQPKSAKEADTPETDPEVLAAIEEANQQLLKGADDTAAEAENSPVPETAE